ncbi:hypothetical protein ACSEON_17285 [Pseudomonas aeruginosa]|nr:hypothetical protein [Pseudomonas aeruginosa]HEH8419014.1 hypothetical protein [Pseudomonas aeruginosa]
MAARWRKKCHPEIVLTKIEKVASINSDGRLQFAGFDYFELEPQLHGMIDHDENYSFQTKKQLRDRAIFACLEEGTLSKELFIKKLNREISLFKNKKDYSYTILTSFSISENFPLKRIKFDNSTFISYPSGLPKKYSSRSAHNPRWEQLFKDHPSLPENYTPVAIKVSAKNPSDAVDQALNNIDFIRAIIAINVNPGASFSISFGGQSYQPINKVMLGGMHTLHNPRGELVSKHNFWYEPNYQPITPAQITKKKKVAIQSSIKWIMSSLDLYPKEDSSLLKQSLVRYVRAIDERDRNTIIQKLWSTLESLLAKGESNCDSIVRRCSFLFKDRDYIKQTLENIREYRNRSVHSGLTEEGVDSYCYNLQRFFRALIQFYLASAEKFDSLDEANKFLDLPYSVADINEQEDLAKRHLHLLSEAKKFRLG